MTNFVRDSDGTTHDLTAIRLLFPNMSIPDGAPDLSDIGFRVLTSVSRPDPLPFHHVAPAPAMLIDGVWTQQWQQVPLPSGEVIALLDAALTAHLDTTAQSKRYDNRISCALRAGYPGPFNAEGSAFASWMDACNALAYQIMADVQNGQRPVPTPEELIAEMPAMVWPA